MILSTRRIEKVNKHERIFIDDNVTKEKEKENM